MLANLQWLYLRNNHLTDSGARALVRSPYLQQLRELVLGENEIGAAMQTELRARFGSRAILY